MKNLLALLAVVFSSVVGMGAAAAHEPATQARMVPPWQDASPWPDRVVVTFAGDPATTLAINWRTDSTVAAAAAEIARRAPSRRTAKNTAFSRGCVVVVGGLEPPTPAL